MDKELKGIKDFDLFNNPMVNAARESMTEEDLDHYKKIGESLYGDVNFETSQSLRNMPPPMAEAVAYVENSIRSGLHPSFLDTNEQSLMKDAYGEKWTERFGYVQADEKEIVTLQRS
jgi:hypothetical protein